MNLYIYKLNTFHCEYISLLVIYSLYIIVYVTKKIIYMFYIIIYIIFVKNTYLKYLNIFKLIKKYAYIYIYI